MTPTSSEVVHQDVSILRPRYHYNEAYQWKILALLVRYPQFIHRYGDSVVRPEFFETDHLVMMCRLILDYFKRYSITPSFDSLMAWLSDYSSRYHAPASVVAEFSQVVNYIFNCDMSDGDSIKDSAVEFARRQSLKMAVMSIADKLEKYDDSYESAYVEVQKALMVGQGMASMGVEVFGSVPNMPSLLSNSGPYSTARKIATPFVGLNNARMGGLGPGELFVIAGSSGQGKSMMKSNCAVMASMQSNGQWVAHATLELSELDNLLRYAARILGVTQESIVMNSPEFVSRCKEYIAKDRQIHVKYFPPGQTNVGHLRSWISALSANLGVAPCMLIVDYPDKMVPSRGATDNTFLDQSHVYDEIITLLNDYQACGVVSSQVDRSHQFSTDTRSGNLAASIAKLYSADVVGVILQSEKDHENGVGRIWWDKVRRGREKFTSYYRIDFSRAWVMEDPEAASLVEVGRRKSAPPEGYVPPPPPPGMSPAPMSAPNAPPPAFPPSSTA